MLVMKIGIRSQFAGLLSDATHFHMAGGIFRTRCQEKMPRAREGTRNPLCVRVAEEYSPLHRMGALTDTNSQGACVASTKPPPLRKRLALVRREEGKQSCRPRKRLPCTSATRRCSASLAAREDVCPMSFEIDVI